MRIELGSVQKARISSVIFLDAGIDMVAHAGNNKEHVRRDHDAPVQDAAVEALAGQQHHGQHDGAGQEPEANLELEGHGDGVRGRDGEVPCNARKAKAEEHVEDGGASAGDGCHAREACACHANVGDEVLHPNADGQNRNAQDRLGHIEGHAKREDNIDNLLRGRIDPKDRHGKANDSEPKVKLRRLVVLGHEKERTPRQQPQRRGPQEHHQLDHGLAEKVVEGVQVSESR
mmetsp:Transcript_12293/g.30099  ORF Transcript_12293/g.30099 Transcript_12293/m.30099 type:complete len:231 (-) Transcript_12293:281-973(-)